MDDLRRRTDFSLPRLVWLVVIGFVRGLSGSGTYPSLHVPLRDEDNCRI